jgi:hypothetical protein
VIVAKYSNQLNGLKMPLEDQNYSVMSVYLQDLLRTNPRSVRESKLHHLTLLIRVKEDVFSSSLFSIRSCFTSAWKEHSKRHINVRKLSSLSEPTTTPPNENDNEEETENEAEVGDKDEEHPITSISSTSYDQGDGESNQEWVQISEDRIYTPSADDVGSRLRIDVWVLSASDGSVLAGPTTLFTEPVLSSPTKPPRRTLQTIPGSGAGISGAVRYRIVSYNILAELYATKQVSFCSCLGSFRFILFSINLFFNALLFFLFLFIGISIRRYVEFILAIS